MGFTLFKSGDQLFDEALDLIARKDYSGAREKFRDALSKDNCSKRELAGMFMALIDLGGDRGNIGNYERFLGELDKVRGSSFRFGLTDVSTDAIRNECNLDVAEINAMQMDDSDFMAKGQALIAVAGQFAGSIGDRTLILDELFKEGTATTGNKEALVLQATAYEIMGRGAVLKNPKQAAEYMQMAYTFRKQNGDSGEEDLALMRNYSRSARCWICGRPANGQGIHFMAVSSDITPMFYDKENKDIIRAADEDFAHIYICRPCYTAISNRSNEISKSYYDQAMSEMRAMEARLQAQIAAISTDVAISNMNRRY